MTKKRHADGTSRTWQIDVPILTEPLVVAGAIKVFSLACLLVWALVSLLFAIMGDWSLILPMGLLFAAIGVGLLVVGLVAAAIIYRNGIRYRFTLDDEGVLIETIDRRVHKVNRLLIILGLLLGKPGAVGTGLIAQSQSTQRINWSSVASARCRPGSNAIALANVWRTTAIIFCSRNNYEAIRAQVLAAHAAHRTPVVRRNPIPMLLLYTVLTILAALPLFHLPLEVELFVPFLTLCFALASIWLIPVLAWVVFGGLGTIAAIAASAALEVRPALFGKGSYLAYELLSGDDLAMLALAGLGTLYLVWQSRALLTGRLVSALLGDLIEMGDR